MPEDKMKISEISEKSIWENFILGYEEKTFLSSWNWGEFQKMMGNKIWRLGIYNYSTSGVEYLEAVALVIKITAKRGNFLLLPHCPVIIQNSKFKSQNENSKFKILETLLNKLKEIFGEEKCTFIRINPLWQPAQETQNILKIFGFREAPMHASAYESTLKLDITPSEDELFKNFRKTTRYLIRQSLSNSDITIEKSAKVEDAKIYQELNEEVAKRQKFIPFSFEFIKNEFEVFSKNNQVLWFFGKYKDEVAAAALVVFWSGIGFYHQAASSAKYAQFSIPYLVCWEAIKEARQRKCSLFDFWGYIDPFKNPGHPWAGPTLFKMGFGGYKKEYVKTQDLPLSKKYWLNYVIEKLRRTKRGL